eukprot:SAG31_NODE_1673_length_7560_cov_3.528749_9_plen_88_part_00
MYEDINILIYEMISNPRDRNPVETPGQIHRASVLIQYTEPVSYIKFNMCITYNPDIVVARRTTRAPRPRARWCRDQISTISRRWGAA